MSNLFRRAILALALAAGLAPAFAQAPAPVPALPDAERRQSYVLTASTCACSVNFALYGDSTDYSAWVEVFLNGNRANSDDPTFGWTITSPSGPLSSIARPVTNAVLTFNSPQTGTVQIVGARRPRQTQQFSENRGVPARDLNQRMTDTTATLRELWDKTNDITGRTLAFAPGVQNAGQIPLPPICSGGFLGFAADGKTPVCRSSSGTGNVLLPVADSSHICADGTVGNLKQCVGAAVSCKADNTGVGDATAALNACLAANPSVEIVGGTYLISAALLPISNQIITMSPGVVFQQNTKNTIAFYIGGKTNVTINANGAVTYGKGIYCGNPGQAVTAGCPTGQFVGNVNDVSYYIDGSSIVRINDAHAKNNAGAGIRIEGSTDVFVVAPILEGTNLLSTPIVLEANYQSGITVGNSDNVIIAYPDISGTAQGILVGDGVSTKTVQIISPNFHNITGQHGYYGSRGGVNITNARCQNVALSCIKAQIQTTGQDSYNFVATGVVANVVGGNMFEIGALLGGVGLHNIQVSGRGKDVGRGLAVGGPVSGLTADIIVSETTGEPLIIQGDGSRDLDIAIQSTHSLIDGILVLATSASNINIRPVIRDANISNTGRLGMYVHTATAQIVLHNPVFTDANGLMVNGILNDIAGSTVKVFGSATITGASGTCVNTTGIISAWPISTTLSCGGGNYTTAANIQRGALGDTSVPFTNLVMSGATSGTLDLRPAAVSSTSQIKFPAGTTDFSATGGASQVVKQVSAGGAFTVGQLSCSDLSGSGAGCSATAGITALTGDGTATGPGSAAFTLATVNAGLGLFGSATQVAQVTLNAKGLATAASNVTITPAIGSITGLGTGVATALGVNVGSAGALVVNGGAGGTPSSLNLANASALPTTALTGTLQAAQEPAHTGDVTNSAGSLALTIASNAVTLAKLATQATNTVLANATSGTAVPTALAVGSCDTATKALQWTTNTGFACNSSITAAAVPASGLTGATLAAGVTASSLTSFGSSPALTTPVITGLPTGTGVATANTVSTLVARDGSGNFSAGTITASLTGHASLDLPLTGGTLSGGLVFSTSSSFGAGTLFYNSSFGMALGTKTGSADDFILFTPGGSVVFEVPTGTQNMLFSGKIILNSSFTLGSASSATVSAGEMAFVKTTASGTAPGAAFLKVAAVAGTNAGTCKLIAYAGTSTTPVTIIDNVGAGC